MRGAGGAATLEMVLVTPLLLTMLMLLVQFGLWYHATNVASAAAQEGARACRLETVRADEAEAVAQGLLDQAGGRMFRSPPVVECRRDEHTARVEVTGDVIQVLPVQIITLPAITEASEGPVERFRSPTEDIP